MTQFGFDGMFLGRVDYQDFEVRGKGKSREIVWQTSRNLKSSELFTSILPNVYWTPKGFCWETNCYDEQIIDDTNGGMNNVHQRVGDFLELVGNQTQDYKTNHLIMTFGNDFTFSNPRKWFDNLDKLIYYVNQDTRLVGSRRVNVFYSTPDCYLNAVNKVHTTWETKLDDFFPYADRPYRLWTGFFTSRPSLKYNVRQTGNFLQTVRKLAAFAKLNDMSTADSIGTLERAMGVLQHHDAVSGTEKQHVADDYSKQLWVGVEKGLSVINKAFNFFLNTPNGIII